MSKNYAMSKFRSCCCVNGSSNTVSVFEFDQNMRMLEIEEHKAQHT